MAAALSIAMEHKNYYKILQVDATADPDVIAAAYKRLAQKYHPDTNSSAVATARMQEINQAYAVLHDPAARSRFDQARAARLLDAQPLTRRALHDAPIGGQSAAVPPPTRRITGPRRMLFVIGLLAIGTIIVLGTAMALARPAPTGEPQRVDQVWIGEWRNAAGELFDLRFKLKLSGNNTVRGTVVWRRISADAEATAEQKATAYVTGSFDPVTRLLSIGSYRREDPYNLLEVDEYKLALGGDGKTLAGEMYNSGRWSGTLTAALKE